MGNNGGGIIRGKAARGLFWLGCVCRYMFSKPASLLWKKTKKEEEEDEDLERGGATTHACIHGCKDVQAKVECTVRFLYSVRVLH
jgi:hypothetical protein